jgi:hypothetical protein
MKKYCFMMTVSQLWLGDDCRVCLCEERSDVAIYRPRDWIAALRSQ